MKKYIVLLLCLMMLLMMVACGETTPTTIGSDTNPSSNTQQNPTEPTKPADGTVDPEDPSLSAYEKEFYQRFNAGQQVTLRLEDINIAISIHGQSGKLLAKVSISGYEDSLPTLEGECEGKFQYEFQMFYENDSVKGENGGAYRSIRVTTSRAVPMWLAIFSWVIFRTELSSSAASSSRKAASRLSKLFHITCSTSHISSEKWLEISSLQ